MLPPTASLQISLLTENFKGFVSRKTSQNEQNRLVLVNLTSTGCRHKWGIHRWNKSFQLLQQTGASLCKIPAMRNKFQSSPRNIFCWRSGFRLFRYQINVSDASRLLLLPPYKVEGLLLEETEEPGPVFVEIVSFTFTVRVLGSRPVSGLHSHRKQHISQPQLHYWDYSSFSANQDVIEEQAVTLQVQR